MNHRIPQRAAMILTQVAHPLKWIPAFAGMTTLWCVLRVLFSRIYRFFLKVVIPAKAGIHFKTRRFQGAKLELLIMAIIAFGSPAHAAGTNFWLQAGTEIFYKGIFNGTALTQNGRVALGFKMKKTGTSTEPFFWAAVYDKKGGLWVGSGNKAILYKYDDKKGLEEMAILPGVGITSIAIDSENNIYAAVFPDAKIFKFDKKGDRSEFASLPATYVWDMKFDDKNNLYCVTGAGAGAYKITPKKKVLNLYASREKHFLSMFLDGKGHLYTGTSPQGLILRINLEEAEKGFPPPQKSAAGNDSSDKNAADNNNSEKKNAGKMNSGDKNITKMNSGNNNEDNNDDEKNNEGNNANNKLDMLLLDEALSPEALAGLNIPLDEAGEFEMPADPRVTVILDMDEDEAYRLEPMPDGRFLVAVNRDQMPMPPSPSSAQQGRPGPQPRRDPISFPFSAASNQPGLPPIPSRVYLVSPDGDSRLLIELPDPYILSLHAVGGNFYMLGTGNEGRIYTLDMTTEKASVQSLPVSQVLAFDGAATNLKVATGNPGALFSMKGDKVAKGTFTSSINDAQTSAVYGNLDYVAIISAGAFIEFQTRTGNTPDPMDGVWSAWSKPASGSPFIITSPPGRYIQYKASFTASPGGETARLIEVRIYYTTQNQPPQINQFTALPQPDSRASSFPGGMPGGGGPGGGTGGPQMSQMQRQSPIPAGPPEKNLIVGTIATSDAISFRWTVSDPDNDAITAVLDVRQVSSDNWVRLDKDIPIQLSEYKWNTTSFPDGVYAARLTVSDIKSNPPDKAREDSLISDPFIVDHSNPSVVINSLEPGYNGSYVITAALTDPGSIISSAEYSVRDQEWTVVFPEDGIFDSKTEKVKFIIPDPGPDAGTLILRARDFVGNTGSASAQIK